MDDFLLFISKSIQIHFKKNGISTKCVTSHILEVATMSIKNSHKIQSDFFFLFVERRNIPLEGLPDNNQHHNQEQQPETAIHCRS